MGKEEAEQRAASLVDCSCPPQEGAKHRCRALGSGWAWRGMLGGFSLVREARGEGRMHVTWEQWGQGVAAGRQVGRGARREEMRTRARERQRARGALAGGDVRRR